MSLTKTVLHIRERLKHEGIKARVIVKEPAIHVVTPTYESRFTSKEIKTICTIAKTNLLTFVRGMDIDPPTQAMLTDKIEWVFYASKT